MVLTPNILNACVYAYHAQHDNIVFIYFFFLINWFNKFELWAVSVFIMASVERVSC